MRFRTSVAAAALAFPALAGCDVFSSLTSGDCTTLLVPAISVTVVDSVSGGDLSHGTTARAREGSFADSVTTPADSSGGPLGIALAWEHTGVFHVSVTHPGYIAWSQSNVRVTKGSCHVNTVRLVAQLVRVP
jgi:hypothetical protein